MNELCLGEFFEYGYDAAGNMTSETTQAGASVNAYDAANRLSSVNGLAYTWDANGNLIHDGVNTYFYDRANRMTAFSDGQSVTHYAYNGLGDRVAQAADGGVTTRYTLDLASGLTQVLSDGSYTYLYGAGRIAQYGAVGPEYFLGDALGSVRQMTDAEGAVVLSRVYEPYGEALGSAGEAETSYAFTGEQVDRATGFVYLRSRWYAPQFGRFTTKDLWNGDQYRPLSYNTWLYAYSNPIFYLDPFGLCPITGPDGHCLLSECAQRGLYPSGQLPLPSLRPTRFCDLKCMKEATKPLSSWIQAESFADKDRAVAARLLLAEIGWRIIDNRNWEKDALAILWTVSNRTEREKARLKEQELPNDRRTIYTQFRGCDQGFTACANYQGQYATTTTSRGLDPLFLIPYAPDRRRSYYHKEEYVQIAVERATQIAAIFHRSGLTDFTQGAVYFSHTPSQTILSRQIDVDNHGSVIIQEGEDGVRIIGYRKYVEPIPFIDNPNFE